MPEIRQKERIAHQAGNKETWICLCGNMPDQDGFYPCDSKGNEMEPVEGWDELYVCAACGRIIDQRTLEVLGQNPHPQMLD